MFSAQFFNFFRKKVIGKTIRNHERISTPGYALLQCSAQSKLESLKISDFDKILEEQMICYIFLGVIFLLGVVPYHILFCKDWFIRLKLGYTLNFTFLGLLEVP